MKTNIKLIKLICLLFLLLLISINCFSSIFNRDLLTQNKIKFFKFQGYNNFIGSLNLWYYFAQKNDWQNADKFDLHLNQTQNFKLSHQPEELRKKLNNLNDKKEKTPQDYLLLAKIQSQLGLNTQAVESVQKAHQIDPIRPDLSQLFYSL